MWFSILGLGFIFLMTSLGALTITFVKKNHDLKLKPIIYGFSGGIMLASSIFSLLIPSIEGKEGINLILPFCGFFIGGLVFILIDFINFDIFKNKVNSSKKMSMVFLSITLHNIPEGLAVGLAFGLGIHLQSDPMIWSALALAIGIGIQNYPEGLAISLPLYQEGFSKKKAMAIGIISGVVEPIFGILGILLLSYLTPILPFLLAFASGAMMIVTLSEMVCETKGSWGKMFLILGFMIMMTLDLIL